MKEEERKTFPKVLSETYLMSQLKSSKPTVAARLGAKAGSIIPLTSKRVLHNLGHFAYISF